MVARVTLSSDIGCVVVVVVGGGGVCLLTWLAPRHFSSEWLALGRGAAAEGIAAASCEVLLGGLHACIYDTTNGACILNLHIIVYSIVENSYIDLHPGPRARRRVARCRSVRSLLRVARARARRDHIHRQLGRLRTCCHLRRPRLSLRFVGELQSTHLCRIACGLGGAGVVANLQVCGGGSPEIISVGVV